MWLVASATRRLTFPRVQVCELLRNHRQWYPKLPTANLVLSRTMMSLGLHVSMITLQTYPSGIHTCRNYNVRFKMKSYSLASPGITTTKISYFANSRIITYAAST